MNVEDGKIEPSQTKSVSIKQKTMLNKSKLNNKKKHSIECAQCHKTLSSESRLQKHLNTVHQVKEFICDYDGRTFNTKDKLRLHVYLHRKYFKLKCNVCDKEYKTNQSMRKHLLTHFQQLQCSICGQVFKYKSLLKNHIAAVHDEAQIISCNYCTRLFPNTITRDSHQVLIHKDKQVNTKHFKCKECGVGFEMREELRLHTFIHFDGTIHTCLDCNQIFKKKKLLKLHMRMHEKANFSCSSCSQMFKYKSNLNKHIKGGRCKGSKVQENSDILGEEVADIAKQQFVNITKSFTRSILKPYIEEEEVYEDENIQEQHEKCEIENKVPEPAKRSRKRKNNQYQCDLCEFTTGMKYKILSHIRQHISSIRHKCKICFETFRTKMELHQHSVKTHGHGVFGSLKYSKAALECKICGKFFSIERMPYHMNLHITPKLTCDKCGFLYRDKNALERHMRIRHENACKFTCSICGKNFKKKSILKLHEETHNPIKIYIKCEICNTTVQMKNHKMHMENKHGNKYKEKHFTCECGKSFRYQRQLDKHKEQVHEAKNLGTLYHCPECDCVFTRRNQLRNHSFFHYAGPVYTCPTCNMKFKKKKLLYIHSRVHTSFRFPCNQCECIFKTSGGRHKHLLKVHNECEIETEIITWT